MLIYAGRAIQWLSWLNSTQKHPNWFHEEKTPAQTTTGAIKIAIKSPSLPEIISRLFSRKHPNALSLSQCALT